MLLSLSYSLNFYLPFTKWKNCMSSPLAGFPCLSLSFSFSRSFLSILFECHLFHSNSYHMVVIKENYTHYTLIHSHMHAVAAAKNSLPSSILNGILINNRNAEAYFGCRCECFVARNPQNKLVVCWKFKEEEAKHC